MSSKESLPNCVSYQHAYNEDFTRDQHFISSTRRWINCFHHRCPVRYNDRRGEELQRPRLKPTTHQEGGIHRAHGTQPPIIATVTSRTTPRVVSKALPPPQTAASTPTDESGSEPQSQPASEEFIQRPPSVIEPREDKGKT